MGLAVTRCGFFSDTDKWFHVAGWRVYPSHQLWGWKKAGWRFTVSCPSDMLRSWNFTQSTKGKVKVKVTQLCLTLCDSTDYIYSPWNSPGQNAGVGSLSLLQGILPTQGSNPGLPHCRQILHQLSQQGNPNIPWENHDSKRHMYPNVLFILARTWKQSKCPTTDEWIKMTWYIYTMEYYSAIKGAKLGHL